MNIITIYFIEDYSSQRNYQTTSSNEIISSYILRKPLRIASPLWNIRVKDDSGDASKDSINNRLIRFNDANLHLLNEMVIFTSRLID